MIARYRQLSFLWGIPGFFLHFFSLAGLAGLEPTGKTSWPAIVAGGLFLVLANVPLFIGLAYSARAKGRHPMWCLFGFLGLIGFMVLACLDDRAPPQPCVARWKGV
jgi:hypothetical protein